MMFYLVLASIVGLTVSLTTTTLPPEHDCRTDHRPNADDPHKYDVTAGKGVWEERWCNPPHLIFVMAERCYCGWSDPVLTGGDCNTINRPSTVNPSLNYMYEYWHPVDNVWYEKNCHDVLRGTHNNDHLFFNVTGCSCDWVPGAPPYIAPSMPDCTIDMDIEMNKQPPEDALGSFVQPFDPVWKVWPPTVAIGTHAGRDALRCADSRLKSWYLQGNEKRDIWFSLSLYSEDSDSPGEYRVVLSDGCASIIVGDPTVHDATFTVEYRANPCSVRITFRGGIWECNRGGNNVGSWVDLVLYYSPAVGPEDWFRLYVDGVVCTLTMVQTPRAFEVEENPFFKISDDCELNICGNPLDVSTKYTGYVGRFIERSGAACSP